MSWKQNLISGYQAFRAGAYREQKDLYNRLGTKGQKPKVMLICCCDSRADPSDIFDAYPGEIFVLRNVANLVPPYDSDQAYPGGSAALEFAVNALGVEAIVVMGHESCGGVAGYCNGLGDDENSSIGRWVRILNGAEDYIDESDSENGDRERLIEFAGIRKSLDQLKTFPFIAEKVNAGKLDLMGAYFSIIRGQLQFADENGKFTVVPTKPE